MPTSNYTISKDTPVYIGSDHAGFRHKQEIFSYLSDKKMNVIDKGTFSDDSTDYPDYAYAVAEEVDKNPLGTIGILVCGSGNGVAITANKLKNVRAALCWNEEITALARKHNNANIICLGSRFINVSVCIEYINLFLSTPFEGGRHQVRINKILAGYKPVC